MNTLGTKFLDPSTVSEMQVRVFNGTSSTSQGSEIPHTLFFQLCHITAVLKQKSQSTQKSIRESNKNMNDHVDRSMASRGLVKPVIKKVSRIRRRASPVDVEKALTNGLNKGPNMSRKHGGTKLHPFPVFDKCDSLIFFPAQFTSILNSGDFNSFRRLMKTRFDKDCVVNLCAGLAVNVPMFVKCFEFMEQLRPDTVMCVHTTKVVGNQICSLIYFKFTESKPLRAAVIKSCSDQAVVHICQPTNHNDAKMVPFLSSKTEKERARLSKIIYEADEMVVYGTTYLTLTFDDVTKCVTRLDMDSDFTTFRLP